MNRKHPLTPGNLFISEVVTLQRAKRPEGVYGYALADIHGEEAVVNGTVYRRLGKLAEQGLLDSHIEDKTSADSHIGPPRKVFTLTEDGQRFLQEALALLGIEQPTETAE